ncbi:hypothetical protein SLEP1_g32936 [Rubroshorea leprosula]|uniref:Uncharacterized protein n=1 Tax=Rubroshorea leprosula TaxID=152421 RepID=A0AAV5KF24_9ROSI|nr:hypothetical protein SLEP1_g32936 [Rubroshorea leprosula]
MLASVKTDDAEGYQYICYTSMLISTNPKCKLRN